MSILCPICSDDNNDLVETFNKYTLYNCRTCDVVFADPMKTDMAFYDESVYYLFRDKLILDVLRWDFRWDMLEFLKDPPVKEGSLLDIGCGTGYFVKRAADMGFKAYGIDLNERSVMVGKEHFKIDTLYADDITGFKERFPGLKFDVVTLFQVLEHLEDPNRIITEIKQVITKDAVVVIALPFRGRWPDTDGEGDYPPHHLTRWSLSAIEYFLNKNGFYIKRHRVENFPLRNMSSIIYNHVLKLAPFLTMRGQGVDSRLDDINEEQALKILMKRRTNMKIANIFGIPVWILYKLFGAKGPHMYIEAQVMDNN